MMIGAWRVDPPPSAMRTLWTSAGIGGQNYGAYSNPVFDSLVTAASSASEPETAQRLWDEAIGVINDDAAAVWLFSPSTVAGVHRRFSNVTIRPDFWAATLWTWRAN